VAGAGLHPQLTLPVSLDCGTDNEELLHDPHYQGYPKRRLRGDAYVAFIEAFVGAVKAVYPDALMQWADFKQHNAIRLLDHYRHRLPCFNADIQGTAAVLCAGILASLQHTGEKLSAQRLVLLGSGAAAIGIARLVQAIIRSEDATEDETRRAVTMLDSQGLLFEAIQGHYCQTCLRSPNQRRHYLCRYNERAQCLSAGQRFQPQPFPRGEASELAALYCHPAARLCTRHCTSQPLPEPAERDNS
jgi:malic enzyme